MNLIWWEGMVGASLLFYEQMLQVASTLMVRRNQVPGDSSNLLMFVELTNEYLVRVLSLTLWNVNE